MKTGKTTRIIDRSVQELFSNGFTFIYDGRKSKWNAKTKRTFERFCVRLLNEHPITKYKYESGVHCGIWCYKITLL